MESFELIIVGAGPAGATLARLAGPDRRTLLLESRDLEGRSSGGERGKCCGGLLAPDAQEALAGLGLGLPRGILVGPQLFAVRTIDLDNGLERHYQRHYINMDRAAFDRWLLSLVPPSAEVRTGCRFVGAERAENGVRVRYVFRGKENTAETAVLVGADGGGSTVRRRMFPGRSWPRIYVSIQEWFAVREPLPYFSSIFDRSVTDFYSWTIPKEDRLVVGTAVPLGGNPAHKFAFLISKLAGKGYELGKPLKRAGALILRPDRLSQILIGDGRVALIGEAAGWISPSSAEGISYAFRSAAALARALRPGPDGLAAAHWRRTAALRMNIRGKILKAPFMYQPGLRKLVMASGLKSVKSLGSK